LTRERLDPPAILTRMDDGLEAELRGAEVRDGTLYIDYAVENRSPHRALLANRLFRRVPEGLRIDRNVAYAELDGAALLVRKQFVDVPEGMDAEAPELPFLTAVPAGGRFAETLELALPVPPRHPYAPQPEGPVQEVGQVALALGYLLEDEPLDVAPFALAGGGVELRAELPVLRMRQRVKTLGPAAARVPTTIAG
jgi:hypothetical protein